MEKKILVTKCFLIYILLLFIEISLTALSGNSFITSQKIMLGIICMICVYQGFRNKFVLNPYFCFILTPFSLMIYNPEVSSRFLTELDDVVYILAICSFLAFLAGLDVYTSRIRSDYSYDNNYKYIGYESEFARIGVFLAVIWILYQVARNVFHISIPFSAIIVQLVYISIAFLLKSGKKYAFILVAMMSVYMLMSNFRKTAFLYIFVLVLLTVFNKKDTSRKTMVLGMLAVLVGGCFMIFIAYPLKMYFSANGSFSGLSGGMSGLVTIMEEESVGYGELGGSVFLLRPYLSMTTEWTNLNYVINTQPTSTHGMWFLRPVLNILQVNTESMAVYELLPRSNYYNTFGFLTIQIKDFGYIGAIVFTFFLGLFTGWCYRCFREHQNNTIEITRYVFVSCSVLEMFFSNHFLLGGVHIVYLVTWIILFMLRRTNPRAYEVMQM